MCCKRITNFNNLFLGTRFSTKSNRSSRKWCVYEKEFAQSSSNNSDIVQDTFNWTSCFQVLRSNIILSYLYDVYSFIRSKTFLMYFLYFITRQLLNLDKLDLTDNNLNDVPSSAMVAIPQIRELQLSQNPIRRIKSFAFSYLNELIKLGQQILHK